jgi:hypothetical protein
MITDGLSRQAAFVASTARAWRFQMLHDSPGT